MALVFLLKMALQVFFLRISDPRPCRGGGVAPAGSWAPWVWHSPKSLSKVTQDERKSMSMQLFIQHRKVAKQIILIYNLYITNHNSATVEGTSFYLFSCSSFDLWPHQDFDSIINLAQVVAEEPDAFLFDETYTKEDWEMWRIRRTVGSGWKQKRKTDSLKPLELSVSAGAGFWIGFSFDSFLSLVDPWSTLLAVWMLYSLFLLHFVGFSMIGSFCFRPGSFKCDVAPTGSLASKVGKSPYFTEIQVSEICPDI